jgi:hypothetical protein
VETEVAEKEGSELVFERSDFGELLSGHGSQQASGEKKEGESSSGETPVALSSVAEPPPGAWGTHAEPPYSVQRISPTSSGIVTAEPIAQPLGMVLSQRKTKLFIALGAFALTLAFAAGFLAGFLVRN